MTKQCTGYDLLDNLESFPLSGLTKMHELGLTKSMRVDLNRDPDFTRKYGKQVKAMGGRYSHVRGDGLHRYVHLPTTREGWALAAELVREFPGCRWHNRKEWPSTSIFVSSPYDDHIHIYVEVDEDPLKVAAENAQTHIPKLLDAKAQDDTEREARQERLRQAEALKAAKAQAMEVLASQGIDLDTPEGWAQLTEDYSHEAQAIEEPARY